MKNSMKKLSFLLVGLVLLLAACGGGESTGSKENENNSGGDAEEAKTFKIGVTQSSDHPSLNAAYDGFKAALEEAGLQVEYDEQNALGDKSLNMTIAQNLVNGGVDLIFANSTPSAQAAASVTSDVPVIFTSVSDPVGAQLVESMESPGANVTGTTDLHPDTIKNTVLFLKNELGVENIGMVYNTAEQNSVAQVNQVKEVATEEGLTVVEAVVATSADVKQASESLVGKIDAFYIITDNDVVSAFESVVDVANTNQLPLLAGELDSVARGAFGAYGFEYYDIGYEAGQMAVKILNGEATPSEIPASYPANLKLVINKETADTLDLEVKESWKAEVSN